MVIDAMTKRQSRQGYPSYLLRLWQTSDGGRQVCRASLQSPDSEERQGKRMLNTATHSNRFIVCIVLPPNAAEVTLWPWLAPGATAHGVGRIEY